jgi:hypothetical protein
MAKERKSEDYRKAAEDSLELAKVLAGQGNLSDQDFLERMAESDSLVDHDGESCGMCCNIILGAQLAREMLEAGEYEDVVSKWATEARRRWENTKFFKLWQQGEARPSQGIPEARLGTIGEKENNKAALTQKECR